MGFEHWVQLFDTEASLADAVARFLRDGWQSGESLIAIVRDRHRPLIAARLLALGVAPQQLVETGQLEFSSAESALASLMRQGRPDPDRFEALVGGRVRERAGHGPGLRVYGEIVDLLADENDLASAQTLEALWNDLGQETAFTLFCGYSAVNFGDPATRPSLLAICRAHSEVRSNPRDPLGAFLSGPVAIRG